MEVIGHKTCGTYVATKAILKGCKSGLFAYFGQFPCSWIQIHIPNTKASQINANPDRDIRVHNIVQDIVDADPNSRFQILQHVQFYNMYYKVFYLC
jgi:hypothetical protein